MPSDATRQLVALAREGEKARRRIDEVENLVQSLAASVTDLARRAAGAAADGPRSWLLADDPDRAADTLTELAVWAEQVYLRYAGAALPSCWAWHPDVVEELLWLRGAHAAAYGADGSWQRVADWHDRHRPGVVTRIRRAAGDCELALHTDPAPAPRTPLANTTTEIAVSWTTEHRMPEPTDAQLDDARRYDRAQRSRTNR